MVLKRKRSESELSFISTLSSPLRPEPGSFDFGAMAAVGWGAPSSRPSTPSYLHSRTMKRFRDNRPPEAEVHQRTLNLLYSARQHPQNSSEAQAHVGMVMQISTPVEQQARRAPHQRSLHSFWKLPVAAPSSGAPPLSSLPVASHNACTKCEDCGGDPGDADMMMDLDGRGAEGHRCGACGKTICFSCSISNLGHHVRCLACAERGVLVGEVGWPRVRAC